MWPRKQQFWNFRRNTSKFQNGDCDLTDTQGCGLRAVSDPRAPGEALTRRGVGTACGGTEARRGQFSPRAQGSSVSAHFLQLYPVGRDGPPPWHAACPGMETLDLSEKWAEAGGAALDEMESPPLPAPPQEGPAPKQRRFPQERVKQPSAKTN